MIKKTLGSSNIIIKNIGIILSIGSVGVCIYAGLVVAAIIGLEKANDWAGAYTLSFLLDFFFSQPLNSFMSLSIFKYVMNQN